MANELQPLHFTVLETQLFSMKNLFNFTLLPLEYTPNTCSFVLLVGQQGFARIGFVSYPQLADIAHNRNSGCYYCLSYFLIFKKLIYSKFV